jgi:hypothetical protein
MRGLDEARDGLAGRVVRVTKVAMSRDEETSQGTRYHEDIAAVGARLGVGASRGVEQSLHGCVEVGVLVVHGCSLSLQGRRLGGVE